MCCRRGAQRRVPQSATYKQTNRTFKNIRVECRKQIPTYDTNRAGVTNCRERANLSASGRKYTSRYSSLQTTCADPWKIHKPTVKKSLRVVNDLDTAQSLGIKLGQKLCPTCLKRGKAFQNKCDTESLEETDEDLYESHEDLKEKLDTSFKSCSPIKTRNILSKRSYCSRKVSQIASATKGKIAKVMDIDESEFDREEGKTHHQSHCDSQLHRLMELLKEKCEISSRQEKLRLLTLVPDT